MIRIKINLKSHRLSVMVYLFGDIDFACGEASICLNCEYLYAKLRVCSMTIQIKINFKSHKLSAMVYLIADTDSDVKHESMIEWPY